jgi:phage protein D
MPFDSNSGVKDSRPKIFVGGTEQPTLTGGLLQLLVAEDTSGLYRCEAKFGNLGPIDGKSDFLYFDRKTLDFGKDFEIKLGTDSIFAGRITALEANFPAADTPEITVLAEDRFQDLRMTRRTRTFTDVSDSDVFNQIANDHGLSPSVNVSGPTHKVLAQVNQSDLAFMRERARAIGAELWMDGKTLNVKPRTERKGEPIKLKYKAELHEFTVIADLATQRTSLTVSSWDASSKSEAKHEATDSAISSETGGDTSGVSILKSAFGDRKESLTHTVSMNSQEAQAYAESYFKTMARRFVVGHGVAEPDARLRVGATIELDLVGPLFNGKYYLSEVKHIFDNAKGYRVCFCGERAGIGQP